MIFRYPGGKSRRSVREWIVSHFPAFSEYREPMVGGGGVFWSIDPHVKRWINDLHPGLMAVYAALRDEPERFIHDCKRIPLDRVREAFEGIKTNPAIDPALRYYLINRVGWGGRVNYDIPSRLYFSNPTGWRIVHNTDKLERAAAQLQGVKITSMDYRELLTEPGLEVMVYLDPPYVKDTELAASSQLYQHSFSMTDHEQLADRVKACQHKVAVSYDDHPAIRELYHGFRFVENSWKYCGTQDGRPKREGREILILNY